MISESLLGALDRLQQSMVSSLPDDEADSVDSDLARAHELLLKAGRQQMRTAQSAEQVADSAKGLIGGVSEDLSEKRSKIRALEERAWSDRQTLLDWVDAQDDVITLARQQGDPRLIQWFERVAQRADAALSGLGVVEISAMGLPFNEQQHEALELVTSREVPQSHVVSVVRRGFLFDGRLLRRSQVVVSKGAMR